MEFLVLFITGLAVGLISAFFGVGGGTIIVPVLYTLYPTLGPVSTISISLGTIVLNTALNNWRFYKQGMFPAKKDIVTIFATAAAGALIGAQVLYLLPAEMVKKIFGFLLLSIALKIAFDRQKLHDENRPLVIKTVPLSITCFLGAFASSITGLGGGTIFVPFLLGFVKLPVRLVSPFSNVAMTAASLIGLIPHFFVPGAFELKSQLAQNSFIGQVNILFILCLFAGTFFSSKLGVKLHAIANAKTKKHLLTVLMFVLALKTLLGD